MCCECGCRFKPRDVSKAQIRSSKPEPMLLFLPFIWFSPTQRVNQRDAAFTSQIRQNNHLRAPFARTLRTLTPVLSQEGRGHNTYHLTGPPSTQTTICLRRLFPVCWVCWMPTQGQGKPLYLIAVLKILITLLPWKHRTVKEQLLGEPWAAGGAISALS